MPRAPFRTFLDGTVITAKTRFAVAHTTHTLPGKGARIGASHNGAVFPGVTRIAHASSVKGALAIARAHVRAIFGLASSTMKATHADASTTSHADAMARAALVACLH